MDIPTILSVAGLGLAAFSLGMSLGRILTARQYETQQRNNQRKDGESTVDNIK